MFRRNGEREKRGAPFFAEVEQLFVTFREREKHDTVFFAEVAAFLSVSEREKGET